MIKVVSFKICPFVQRVTAALEAIKVPYEIEYISLRDKPKWFLEISPNGQVPVLLTESGKALFESDAIIEFIEDEYGPLEKSLSSENKAYQRAWSYQATKHYLSQCSTMRSSDKYTLVERTKQLSIAFARVEKELSEFKMFSNDEIGKVDIAWLPLLYRAKIIKDKTSYDLLEGFPKLQNWQSEIIKSDIVRNSVSDDFEEKFCDFYLSKNTYLGSLKSNGSKVENSCCSGTCTKESCHEDSCCECNCSVESNCVESCCEEASCVDTCCEEGLCVKACCKKGRCIEIGLEEACC